MLSDRRFAITSLILGIIGLFYSGLIAGGIAITFAIIAIAKDYRGDEATAGLVLGIICVCSILVQAMGLDFGFYFELEESIKSSLLALMNISFFPTYTLAYFCHVIDLISAHIDAITVTIFLGGTIPFHWVYTIVASLLSKIPF